MAHRTPLVLLLLAVGVVCFLLWGVGLSSLFDATDESDATSMLDDEDVRSADGDEREDAGPTLTTTGRAREANAAARAAALAAAAGIEGPGGVRGSDASVPFVGKVLDKDGRPASGVKIVMRGAGSVETVTTDADGRFNHAARPGRYGMLIDGGEQGSLLLRSWMLDGEAREDLEFALKEPAAVQVKVTRTKEPVPDVAVLIISRDLGELSQQAGTTGLDGLALFEGLPPGRYIVTAQVPEGPLVEHSMYAGAAKTSPVNVVVPQGVALKGVVRAGKDGPGVGGAVITLKTQARGSHGLFETVFETNPDGTYEMLVPRGNPRSLTVEAEGHARWPTPKQTRGILRGLRGLRGSKPVKRDVTLLSGAVLNGIVTTGEKKTPVPGVSLRFAMRRGPVVEVTTKADGSYLAANMVPGRYELQVETPAWFPVAGQALAVGIPGGAEPKATTFDLELVGARRLHGSVVDGAGAGVGGARVWIVGGGRVVRSARSAGRVLEVFTNANGTWLITDIPPDKNVVVRAAMGKLEADPVSAPWEKPPPLPLRLPLKGTGDIEGRVVDLDLRTPIGGVRVRIVPDPYDGRTGRTVWTNGKGEFKVEGMLPGAWTFTPYKRGYLTAQPDTATVVRDKAVSVALRLDPGLVFAGEVVNEAGQPLRYARITVRGTPDGAEKVESRGATTNAKGQFSLMGFKHGTYTISARMRRLKTQVFRNQQRTHRALRFILRK